MKLAAGGLAGYLLFMFIIIYGNMIMRSVIEEKTSRIIEVIISSVKPTQFIIGQNIRHHLSRYHTILTWVIVGGILMAIIPAIFGIDIAGAQIEQQQEVLNQVANNSDSQDKLSVLYQELVNLPIANIVVMFVFLFHRRLSTICILICGNRRSCR